MDRIRVPEDTHEGYRLEGGITVVPRAAIRRYGMDYLRHLFPDSSIHAAEDLITSDPADGQVRPETPGGQP